MTEILLKVSLNTINQPRVIVELSSDAFTSQMSFRTKIFPCIFQLKLHISQDLWLLFWKICIKTFSQKLLNNLFQYTYILNGQESFHTKIFPYTFHIKHDFKQKFLSCFFGKYVVLIEIYREIFYEINCSAISEKMF
jgi:hypothetical protein